MMESLSFGQSHGHNQTIEVCFEYSNLMASIWHIWHQAVIISSETLEDIFITNFGIMHTLAIFKTFQFGLNEAGL